MLFRSLFKKQRGPHRPANRRAPGRVARPGKARNPAKTLYSARYVNPAAAAGARQLSPVQRWLPQQANPPVASTATQPRVNSRPIQAVRWDETSITDDQDNSVPAHAYGQPERGNSAPYLPADQGWRGNSALALTTDDSKRRPNGENCTRLNSAMT